MIKVKNLGFSYENNTILQKVDFESNKGEITVVLGANGTGKTTMLKCMMNFLQFQGDVFINEENTKNLSFEQLCEYVGYLTQELPIKTNLKVFEVILLGMIGSLRFKVSDEHITKVNAILKQFKVEELANKFLYELSGGQRRLALIAQILIKHPQILLLDEPTSNLDIKHQIEVLNIIQQYTKKNNVTTIMTLHDLNLASRYADNIVLLHQGKVLISGKTNDVMKKENLEKVYEVQFEFFESIRLNKVINALDLI